MKRLILLLLLASYSFTTLAVSTKKAEPAVNSELPALLQKLDWLALVELADQAAGITNEDAEALLTCIITSYEPGLDPAHADLSDVAFQCLTGQTIDDIKAAIKDFVVDNWDEPYYQGQATAFTLTLLSPFKAKILDKVKNLPKFTKSLTKLDKLAQATTKDELVAIAKSLTSRFANFKNVGKLPDNVLSQLDPATWTDDLLRQLDADLADEALLQAFKESELVEAWKVLDDLGETAFKTDIYWLKRVDDWDGAGVQLSKNGDNLKLSDGSGNALGEFKNGDLLPEKYDFPVNASSTPVGDVNNGYQVFKDGSGNLSVRRIPDKSSYNASELTELTQHPNAHVLERHGHDVTDDALIKRAQTPSVAPDGKVARRSPPHSSKFNSADDLKEGLNNTKPGTPAFNNGVQQGNTRVVTYTSTKVLGKGVPRNGSSFVNMQKVKAVYEDFGNGNYQLITMYPEL